MTEIFERAELVTLVPPLSDQFSYCGPWDTAANSECFVNANFRHKNCVTNKIHVNYTSYWPSEKD